MTDLSAYTRLCLSCDAPIVFARTITGRTMPVDVEPVPGGNVAVEVRQGFIRATVLTGQVADRDDLRVAHFVTCPDAKEWRKR